MPTFYKDKKLMKYEIKPTDKVIFHVDDKEFEEFMDAWRLMQFYWGMKTKCLFWVEYREEL